MIFTLCKHALDPPNQHAIPSLWFVYIANNFNDSPECHLFILHISTHIYRIIVNEMYTIVR